MLFFSTTPSTLLSATNIKNSDDNVVGWTNKAKEGDEVSIEADLRSGEREERRIRFLVNGRREKTVIVGVPESIRFCVCVLYHPLFFHLYSSL